LDSLKKILKIGRGVISLAFLVPAVKTFLLALYILTVKDSVIKRSSKMVFKM